MAFPLLWMRRKRRIIRGRDPDYSYRRAGGPKRGNEGHHTAYGSKDINQIPGRRNKNAS
jgi:hypothetical protein